MNIEIGSRLSICLDWIDYWDLFPIYSKEIKSYDTKYYLHFWKLSITLIWINKENK